MNIISSSNHERDDDAAAAAAAAAVADDDDEEEEGECGSISCGVATACQGGIEHDRMCVDGAPKTP